MTYREKKIVVLVALSCSIFGVFFVGSRLIQSVDLNQFLGNAAAIIFLALGAWASVGTIRNANADRQARRFRNSYDLRHTAGGAVIISDNPQIYTAFFPNPNQRHGGAAYMPETAQPAQYQTLPLMPALSHCERLLIIGGMGAGKSELLKHLCALHAQAGRVIVIDPHASPDQWNDAEVVGMGRDYAKIQGVFDYLTQEIDRRYHQLADGVKQFAKITVVIDELTIINQFLDLKDHFKQLLTESRKVNIGLIFCGQSDRVKSIGLERNGDLIQGFQMICRLENDAGRRLANLTTGTGKQIGTFDHPGPYRQIEYSDWHESDDSVRCGSANDCGSDRCGSAKPVSFITGALGTGAASGASGSAAGDDMETDILEIYRRTGSKNRVLFELFGTKSRKNFNMVSEVLRRHGF